MKSKIIIILSILMMISIFCYVLGYIKHNERNNNVNDVNVTNETNIVKEEDYFINGKDRRNIYYCINSLLRIVDYNDENFRDYFVDSLCGDNPIKEIKTDTINRKAFDTFQNEYILYQDDKGVYLFNVKTQETINIKVDNLYNFIYSDDVDISTAVDSFGFVYKDGNYIKYYSIDDKKYDQVKVPVGMTFDDNKYNFLIDNNKIISYIDENEYARQKYYSFVENNYLYKDYHYFECIQNNDEMLLVGQKRKFVYDEKYDDEEIYCTMEMSILNPNHEKNIIKKAFFKDDSKIPDDICRGLFATSLDIEEYGDYLIIDSQPTDDALEYDVQIFTKDFKDIDCGNNNYSIIDGNVLTLNDNKLNIWDKTGTIIKSRELNYKKYFDIVKGSKYALVLDEEDNILVVDIDGVELNIGKYDNAYEYYSSYIEKNKITISFLKTPNDRCSIKYYEYNINKKTTKTGTRCDEYINYNANNALN